MSACSSFEAALQQGWLFLCDRSAAKRLFGAREAAEMRRCLEACWTDQGSSRRDGTSAPSAVICDGQWHSLQRLLNDAGKTTPDRLLALQHCFTGGRLLCDESDLQVWLVRPDMVPHVAAALQPCEGILASGNSEPPGPIELLRETTRLYQHAAEQGASVVFAVCRRLSP